MPQSAASRHLAEVEQALGGPLFHRTGRGVADLAHVRHDGVPHPRREGDELVVDRHLLGGRVAALPAEQRAIVEVVAAEDGVYVTHIRDHEVEWRAEVPDHALAPLKPGMTARVRLEGGRENLGILAFELGLQPGLGREILGVVEWLGPAERIGDPAHAQNLIDGGKRLQARWASGAPAREPRHTWASLAGSLARTLAGWALGGFGWLTGQPLARRRGACLACPHYLPGRVARCGLCGCVLAAKQRLPQATCPAGKWEAA